MKVKSVRAGEYTAPPSGERMMSSCDHVTMYIGNMSGEYIGDRTFQITYAGFKVFSYTI